jgi:hypothetical protein
MKHKFVRLILILMLLLTYWFIYPWYNISFSIIIFTFNLDHVIVLLMLLYVLLEYRIYTKDNNEFYYFVFWLLLTIVVLCLYLTIIQIFVLIPKDFLVYTEHFKIQINYSSGYLLFRISKYLDNLTDTTGISDPTILNIFKKLFGSIYFNEIICNVKTLEDLNQLLEGSKLMCYNTFNNIL